MAKGNWVENKYGGFDLVAGLDSGDTNGLTLSITDQRDRGAGWVFHASVGGFNGGDTIFQQGYWKTADEAKERCEAWALHFCRRTLAAIGAAE